MGFPGGAVVKNPPASVGYTRAVGSIPGLGRSSGGGHGNPLQYSCLGNSTDRGAWWAIDHKVAKNWTRLTTQTCSFPRASLTNDHKLDGSNNRNKLFRTSWGQGSYIQLWAGLAPHGASVGGISPNSGIQYSELPRLLPQGLSPGKN